MQRFAIFLCAFVLAASAAHADDSLFQDMGGEAGMHKIVDVSMANYLADKRINAQFDDVDIDWLKGQLYVQFCQLAGGPCVYKGHDMRVVHQGMHLTDADFNALVEDLQKSMDICGVPFRTQNRFLAILAPMESQVVTK
ncbi:MAG: group 1 truncated hemoglobin [Rhizomicrobium sp.]|jgi:hemoglobin